MSFVRTKFQDIQLGADGDLRIVNGDFVLGPSDQQHIEHIVESEKGNWREHPVVGVGIMRFLNASQKIQNKGKLSRKVGLQLEYDNYRIESIKVSNDLLKNGKQAIEVDAVRIK